MNLIKKIIFWIFDKVISSLMILFYIIMIIALFLQVITRYILKMPMVWTEELSRYMFVWFLFFGAGIAFFENSHIKVELFTSKFPSKFKKIHKIILKIIIIIYLTIVTWKGFELIHFVYRQTTPALEISRAYPYLAIPIGSVIMILGLIYRLIKDVQDND